MSEPSKHAIVTADAPQAIGPYAQAVRAGQWLFLSGQIGLDPTSGALVAGGVEAETERVLANLRAVLAAAGLTVEHVVRTTIWETSPG
jgi:2-iminobutanoate/2-iminopropanoate deaminase